MTYISYDQLAKDVLQWSLQLPRDIDVFIGIGRSGLIPAATLALHRNVRFATLDEFRDGRITTGGQRDRHRGIKKAMVVDDSCLSGRSLQKAQNDLKHIKVPVQYGAVYMDPRFVKSGVHFFKEIELPRIFEWNWLHHYWLQFACLDIDGVLCDDPTPADNDDGLRYRKFLHTARPKHLPTVEVSTLVTSRLEKYRLDTERWLERWGVRYKKLIMHPAENKRERQKAGDHAQRKAEIYKQTDYKLFVESSARQARMIYALTGKPVLCIDNGDFYA